MNSSVKFLKQSKTELIKSKNKIDLLNKFNENQLNNILLKSKMCLIFNISDSNLLKSSDFSQKLSEYVLSYKYINKNIFNKVKHKFNFNEDLKLKNTFILIYSHQDFDKFDNELILFLEDKFKTIFVGGLYKKNLINFYQFYKPQKFNELVSLKKYELVSYSYYMNMFTVMYYNIYFIYNYKYLLHSILNTIQITLSKSISYVGIKADIAQ